MAKIFVLYLVFIISTITSLKAANILAVFPTPSISHQVVFSPITEELARRGHNVTVITTDPIFPKDEAPPNLKEIDVHNISYTVWRAKLAQFSFNRENNGDSLLTILHHITVVFKHQLENAEVQDLIKNKKNNFDLIFVEAIVPAALIFSHIFQAPVIEISSFGAMFATNIIMGAANHPLYQPKVYRHKIYNLTLWEKIYEMYIQYKFEYKDNQQQTEFSIMLKDMFGKETPTIQEMYDNIHMIFLNIHPIWYDNQPVPPGIICLGRLHLRPSKELPTDIKTFMDNSSSGVIYLSLGTNVDPSMLPSQRIKMMIKVLSELPYGVIWVWKTDLPSNSSNIKVFKWIPQLEILRHKKVKLFITQGGMQSTDEAIDGGVPLLGIPVIADQYYNSQKYVKHGIGKRLDVNSFTEEEFKDAVVTIIEDESFKNNIIKLRNIVNDEPQSPLERAIWWTEYVLRHHGAKHLRTPAANMPLSEYYQLNLVLFLFLCLLSIVCVSYFILLYSVRYIRRMIRSIMSKYVKSKSL